MAEEVILKVGDVCLDCQERGLEHFLRYFKINLNGDTLLKCESDECMYPYNDEMTSSDEEEKCVGDNLSEANCLTFIDDFIQQCSNEDQIENSNTGFPMIDNVTEQVTQFDITFLDDLNEFENENIIKPENSKQTYECFDNKFSVKNNDTPCVNPEVIINEPSDHKLSGFPYFEDAYKDCIGKIDTQSIKTIEFEPALNNNLPTTSKSSKESVDIASKFLNRSDTALNEAEPQPLQFPSKRKKSRPKNEATHSPTKLQDIPKADIMKGNALLRKLEEINEKSSQKNAKCKGSRTKTTKGNEIKKQNQSTSTSISGMDYSFEQIAEMLLANKMKNEGKI